MAKGEYDRSKLSPAISQWVKKDKLRKKLLRPYRNRTLVKFYKKFRR